LPIPLSYNYPLVIQAITIKGQQFKGGYITFKGEISKLDFNV